jgi:hypothetical protein
MLEANQVVIDPHPMAGVFPELHGDVLSPERMGNDASQGTTFPRAIHQRGGRLSRI